LVRDRNFPRTHKVHTEDPAPENEAYGQLTQAPLPEVFLYVPGLQAAHADPVYPTLQVQLSKLVLPMEDILVPPHVKHAELPRASLYVFTGHIVQNPPSDPENPGAH
jgi:hypothetical protein